MAYSTKVITDILHAAEARDVLTIQRFAHLISGARMGQDPALTIMRCPGWRGGWLTVPPWTTRPRLAAPERR